MPKDGTLGAACVLCLEPGERNTGVFSCESWSVTRSGVLLTAQKPIKRPGWWKGKFALIWRLATGVGR